MGGFAVSLGSSFTWSILQVLEQGNVENFGWDSAAEWLRRLGVRPGSQTLRWEEPFS